EVYPHDSANVVIEGVDSKGAGREVRVWLEFVPDSKGTVADIPDPGAPFSFHFGRSTSGVVKVGYQLDITNGTAKIGILSHPAHDVTVANSVGPVAIAYLFAGVTAPESFVGVGPQLRDVTLTDQGRV